MRRIDISIRSVGMIVDSDSPARDFFVAMPVPSKFEVADCDLKQSEYHDRSGES
jgi:hypothetical protein